MRVLLVSHLYPPDHRAGTELYTEALARSLVQRGHEVHVLCTHKDIGCIDLSIEECEQDGVRVHRLTQNLFYRRFRETFDHPRIEICIAQILGRLKPDIVHVQHLLYLSHGVMEQAQAYGARILATLHDFGLECARFGQLVDADGKLCHDVEPERCGTCLARFDWRQSGIQRWAGKGLAQLRSWTGINLAPAAVQMAGRRSQGPDDPVGATVPAQAASMAEVSVERRAVLLAAYRLAERVFCPSEFLAARALAAGLDPERVEVLPTGVAMGRLQALERKPRALGAPLRVQFLGTMVPLKGAHVLIGAWEQLGEDLRRGASLHLNGPDDHAPDYAGALAERAQRIGAHWGGRLDSEGVAQALGQADVVVVPSLWFENRPLVILEAQRAGAAVLVSDLGALPELVPDADWRFRAGDEADLAAVLRRLIRNPDLVAAHSPVVPPDWEATVDRVEAAYR